MPLQSIYSSDFRVELEPYAEVLVEGQSIDPLRQLVSGLKLTEEANKRAFLSFDYLDVEKRHLIDPVFRFMQPVTARLGYRTDFEERGPFEITKIDMDLRGDAIALSVKAEIGGKMAQTTRHRTFTAGTLLDMFERVASDYGMVVRPSGNQSFLSWALADADRRVFVQSGESDAQFLTRVCSEMGVRFLLDGKNLYVSDPFSRIDMGTISLDFGLAGSAIQSIKYKQRAPNVSGSDPTSGGFVKVLTDWIQGKGKSADKPQAPAKSASPVKPTGVSAEELGRGAEPKKTGAPIEVGDVFHAVVEVGSRAASAASEVVGDVRKALDFVSTDPAVGHSGEDGESDSRKGYGRSLVAAERLDQVEIRLKNGYMRVRPQGRCVLNDLGPRFGGLATVEKVVQDFSNGFVTEFTARRGFTPRKGSLVPGPLGTPQASPSASSSRSRKPASSPDGGVRAEDLGHGREQKGSK